MPLNLYFIALLLTPVPYDREQSRPRSRSAARRNGISKIVRRLRLDKASSRPATWTPSHFFSSNLVIVAVACQFVTPYIGNQAIRDTVLMAPTIAGFLVFLIEYTRVSCARGADLGCVLMTASYSPHALAQHTQLFTPRTCPTNRLSAQLPS